MHKGIKCKLLFKMNKTLHKTIYAVENLLDYLIYIYKLRLVNISCLQGK